MAERLINNLYGKGTIGFTCDSCGRETNGCNIVNGMKFCAKCYQETFGKDNQQNEIQQLKQQLVEKDKEIELLKHLGNHETATEMFKENAKLIIEKRQLAIQELEKVKNKCNGMYELWLDSNYKENMYNNEDIAGVFEDISVFTNDLIKKLKGE